MIELDWKKLKEVYPVAEYIDLTKPTSVKKGDLITVIQHGSQDVFSSSSQDVFSSSSECLLVGEHTVHVHTF